MKTLVQRLEKLALLIGSDAWSADQAPHAESLIREAALRLTGFMTEDAGRKSVLDAVTSWNNSLREENARLKGERDEALWKLSQFELKFAGEFMWRIEDA